MLSRKKQLNPSTTDTLIGEGTIVEGSITSEASLRIEGQVNGDIHCSGDIIIGERGEVRSDIVARNIINAGSVQGSVSAQEKLTITATGRVQGYISAATLAIVEGGLFHGTSKMEPKMQPDAVDKTDKAIPLKQKDSKAMEGKTAEGKGAAAG